MARSAPLEEELGRLGCDLGRVCAAHGIDDVTQWASFVPVRISVASWLLQCIDGSLCHAQAPPLPSGAEDTEALARVAEMIGVAPPGQGLALLGLGAVVQPAGGKGGGGKGKGEGGGGSSSVGAGDGMELVRVAVELAGESQEWDSVGGWQGLEQRREREGQLMGEIARVASLPPTAESGDLFALHVHGVIPPAPPAIAAAMKEAAAAVGPLGNKLSDHGPPKGSKQWAAGLEEELHRVRGARDAARGRLEEARGASRHAFDGPEADVFGGERDAQTSRLCASLHDLSSAVSRYRGMYETHVGQAVRRVRPPPVNRQLGPAAAAVREQSGANRRLLGALGNIRRASEEVAALVGSSAGAGGGGVVDVARLEGRAETMSRSMAVAGGGG